jgi:flavin reductase (DIM6/NTAB) family NADH-FMN oxidoreductase RutF
MAIDSKALRKCLGLFATGVTVVTYELHGQIRGLTVNAFTAVSLDPPLILVSLDRRHSSASRNLEGQPFAVNVLKVSQQELAMHFAGKPQDGLDIPWTIPQSNRPPRLSNCAALFDCKPWRSYDGGDHVLFLGEVEQMELADDAEPLIFYQGRFRAVGGFTSELTLPTFVPDPGWWLNDSNQYSIPHRR